MTSLPSQASLNSAIAEICAIERVDQWALKQTIVMQGGSAQEKEAQLDRLVECDWLLQMNARYAACETIFLHACEREHKKPKHLLRFAEHATKLQNFDIAVSRLRTVLEKFPRNLPAGLRLCRNLLALGHIGAAAKQIEQLEQLHVDLRVSRLSAEIHVANGRQSEAAKHLACLVSDHPENLEVKHQYASLLIQMGEWQQAKSYLNQISKSHPNHAGTLRRLAQIAFQQRNLEEAEQLWHDVILLTPNDPMAHLNYVKCVFENDGVERALRHVDCIDNLEPARVWNIRIWLLSEGFKSRQALAFIQKQLDANALGTVSPAVLENLLLKKINLLAQLGEDEDAVSAFQGIEGVFSEILKIRPMSTLIRRHLCEILIRFGENKRASAEIDQLPNVTGVEISSLRMWQKHNDGDVTSAKSLWSEYLASHFDPKFQSCTDETLERLDDVEIQDIEREITLITVAKNESNRLPWFLAYYRNLGVTRFVFVDDHSTDTSRAFLLEQPDVHLYLAHETYAQGYSGVRWINDLARRHATRGWVLYVDVDEAFVSPGIEGRGLRPLTAYMESNGHEAMSGFMLDMYSDGPDVMRRHSDDYLKNYPLFENSYCRIPTKNCPYYFQHGGLRRHFGEKENLTKTPLFRGGRDIVLRFSSHVISPAVLSDVTCAVLHYKFVDHATAAFEVDLQENVRNGKCKARHRNYLKYYKGFKRDRQNVLSFENSTQLCDLGLLCYPQKYSDWLGSYDE